MKRALIALAVISTLPAVAWADSPNVSGFADITYNKDSKLSLFKANAEVDVKAKTGDHTSVRLDTDLALAGNGGVNAGVDGPKDSAAIEQAYFAFTGIEKLTVIGGVFNNPIGWEGQDAPDLFQASHGQIYGILDGQTALYGNNIAGVALAGAVGPVTLTGAVLNDLGHSDLEKNSFAIVANLEAMKGLDFELGYVTQDNAKKTNAGNVLDVNATYKIQGFTVGAEFLTADKIVDTAMGVTANYRYNDKFGATIRFDNVSFEAAGAKDSTGITVAGSYSLDKNLDVRAEYKQVDAGSTDKSGVLQFVAKF